MTGEGKREAAELELELAHEELIAADALLEAGLARIATTRAYFAVFHAMRARLYAEGLEPRTHAGVLRLVNVHFIRAGLFPASVGRLLARLQKYREEADYAPSFVVDEAGAREEMEAARQLVETVRSQLGEEEP